MHAEIYYLIDLHFVVFLGDFGYIKCRHEKTVIDIAVVLNNSSVF